MKGQKGWSFAPGVIRFSKGWKVKERNNSDQSSSAIAECNLIGVETEFDLSRPMHNISMRNTRKDLK